jgi:hypothetical protein
MADLPKATTRIDDQAGGFAGSTGYIVVMGCVEKNADLTPRVYSSKSGLVEQHGYSQAVDYAALHLEETAKPVVFLALPTSTPGAVVRKDDSLVTGTSTLTVAAGSFGILDEIVGTVRVITGGTVGTAGIELGISIDGSRSETRVRLNLATSYVIPYVGVTIGFGPGTLNSGDEFTFSTSAPIWSDASLDLARAALSSHQFPSRSWLLAEEIPTVAYAQAARDAVNTYETLNERFTCVRVSLKDKDPAASKTKLSRNMVGSPSLTFANVTPTSGTVTRANGSWITDGFAVSDTVVIKGSVSNNVSGIVTAVAALAITVTATIVNEASVSGASVLASETISFAEVGSVGDTITRSSGSWIAEGFKIGDEIQITGTQLNNITGTVAAVTATVITLDDDDLAPEVIASHLVTVTAVKSFASHVSGLGVAFAGIDAQRRINLGYGRARVRSNITGAIMRRPVQWMASVRQYQHDLHIPTFKKQLGPHSKWSIMNDSGTSVEYDERVHGGALAARFTCARTWANGPNGTFIALDLTRATEASLLSRQHNMDVANLACSIVQAETENFIGTTPQLQPNGRATKSELASYASRVNSVFDRELRSDKQNEGPRASSAVYTPSPNDILNVPAATLNGIASLGLNGTIENVNTSVRVPTGGN